MVDLSSCTNEGVAVDKLSTEPWHIAALVDRVQPERYLSKLYGNRVQVDTVNIVIGNVHLDLLQFVHTALMADSLAKFSLFAVDIRLCKLIDSFVQERSTTHCRLADGKAENFVGGLVFQQLLEGILNKALSKRLRRIVRCGLFTLSASQSIDKLALRVNTELTFFISRFVAYTFFLGVLVKLLSSNEVSDIKLVEAVSGFLDFIEVLLSNKSTIRKQSLIYCTHLVDTEIRIGNTSTTASFFASRLRKAHQVNDT